MTPDSKSSPSVWFAVADHAEPFQARHWKRLFVPFETATTAWSPLSSYSAAIPSWVVCAACMLPHVAEFPHAEPSQTRASYDVPSRSRVTAMISSEVGSEMSFTQPHVFPEVSPMLPPEVHDVPFHT